MIHTQRKQRIEKYWICFKRLIGASAGILDCCIKQIGDKEYLESNCKPVKMLIEKKLEEVDRENVTDEFIRELIDDAYPVCAIFAMG